MRRRMAPSAAAALAAALAATSSSPPALAFAPPRGHSRGPVRRSAVVAFPRPPGAPPGGGALFPPRPRTSSSSSKTSLNLIGQDSGILGVGAPEIAVTLLVGYFVLGPSELYKLVKEIGKFIQNFRTLGTEAAKSFEGTMENQLELTELRKAQAELNEAFSFRRSINTDQYGDAFGGNSFSENTLMGGATATATAAATAVSEEGEGTTTTTNKKRRLVRRRKKKVVEEEEMDVPSEEEMMKEYPDLDMLDADVTDGTASSSSASGAEEWEKRRVERIERLTSSPPSAAEGPDWMTASEEEVASAVFDRPNDNVDPALEAYEKQRFQSQLSAESWNAQVVANEDKLSPLSMAMQRLAILEEEKNAADRRIEEEYQRRMDNEDRYYLEKRRALEDAIAEIQEGAYAMGNNVTKFGA